MLGAHVSGEGGEHIYAGGDGILPPAAADADAAVGQEPGHISLPAVPAVAATAKLAGMMKIDMAAGGGRRL